MMTFLLKLFKKKKKKNQLNEIKNNYPNYRMTITALPDVRLYRSELMVPEFEYR